jgi:murein DD-endopeptidase MepM/ murein hydrolase activator NlpD
MRKLIILCTALIALLAIIGTAQAATIYRGASGPVVAALQTGLVKNHAIKVKVDGIYGPQTAQAVAIVKARYHFAPRYASGNFVGPNAYYIITSTERATPGTIEPNTLGGNVSYSAEGVFPVAGKHYFSNDWHAPHSGGRLHTGNDIFCAKGTPVVAIFSGRVTSAGRSKGDSLGGIRVWIETSRGYFYYAHLQGVAVRYGQYVKAGQVLGWADNTGNARNTPTHLHFGWRGGYGWQNPYYLLRSLP